MNEKKRGNSQRVNVMNLRAQSGAFLFDDKDRYLAIRMNESNGIEMKLTLERTKG